MFEVLVYVYENYWQLDACPELPHLRRRLSAVGFESEEIDAALIWLDGLNTAAQSTQISFPKSSSTSPATPSGPLSAGTSCPTLSLQTQSPNSMRGYSVGEQIHLGSQVLGYVSFLESAGVLLPHMREIVIDRAMATPGNPVDLDDLKIIVLMVYWSFGKEPDALILDELCDDTSGRVAH